MSSQVESRIFQLARQEDGSVYNPDVRTCIFLEVKNLLSGRIDLAERAVQNFTQLKRAYDEGKRLFGYLYLNETKSSLKYMVPKPLLKKALTYNHLAKTGAKLDRYIIHFKENYYQYL